MDGKRIPLTPATSGNFNGDTAGTVKAGASVSIWGPAGGVVNGTLAALVIVDAETNTLTMSAYWQVSEDGSTWYDVSAAANNPANVVLATGTAGHDDRRDRHAAGAAGLFLVIGFSHGAPPKGREKPTGCTMVRASLVYHVWRAGSIRSSSLASSTPKAALRSLGAFRSSSTVMKPSHLRPRGSGATGLYQRFLVLAPAFYHIL